MVDNCGLISLPLSFILSLIDCGSHHSQVHWAAARLQLIILSPCRRSDLPNQCSDHITKLRMKNLTLLWTCDVIYGSRYTFIFHTQHRNNEKFKKSAAQFPYNTWNLAAFLPHNFKNFAASDRTICIFGQVRCHTICDFLPHLNLASVPCQGHTCALTGDHARPNI